MGIVIPLNEGLYSYPDSLKHVLLLLINLKYHYSFNKTDNYVCITFDKNPQIFCKKYNIPLNNASNIEAGIVFEKYNKENWLMWKCSIFGSGTYIFTFHTSGNDRIKTFKPLWYKQASVIKWSMLLFPHQRESVKSNFSFICWQCSKCSLLHKSFNSWHVTSG